MTKVIIVGGGPGGMGAAHTLAHSGKNLEVLLFEKGRSIPQRICPEKEGKSCAKCSPCNIISGDAGAGTFSDGKCMYSTSIGNNLDLILANKQNQEVVDEVEKIFSHYGVKCNNGNSDDERKLMIEAYNKKITYVASKQAHVGSDELPQIMQKIIDGYSDKVKMMREEVLSVEKDHILTKEGKYPYDHLIVGPGRKENKFVEEIAQKFEIAYDYSAIDIGVRVEVPSFVMDPVCKIGWDFKAKMRLSNDDEVRTFCVCPYGFVAKEYHGDFYLVNGHSKKHEKSPNTNFAFLVKWELENPVENANTYGVDLIRSAMRAGGGKPLIQRLGDFRRRRRSTMARIERSDVKRTLQDVTPGDIKIVIPGRFAEDIQEGLDRLNTLVRGVSEDHTLLYYPEIKFHGIRVKANQYLESSRSGTYFIGDASGYSRGIVGAFATGILAARGVLR